MSNTKNARAGSKTPPKSTPSSKENLRSESATSKSRSRQGAVATPVKKRTLRKAKVPRIEVPEGYEPRSSRSQLWMDEILRTFVPIPGKAVTDNVYERIVALIDNGTLHPGDRLPSYTQVAERLGKGKETFSINLAYKRLQRDGITKAIHRAGTFVNDTEIVHATLLNEACSAWIARCRQKGLSIAEITAIFQTQSALHANSEAQQPKRRRSSAK